MQEILQQHKQLLLDYLQSQVKMERWREAMSAIMQLEVIDAQIDLLSELNVD